MRCELKEDCQNEAVVRVTSVNSGNLSFAPPLEQIPTCLEAVLDPDILEEIGNGNIKVEPL